MAETANIATIAERLSKEMFSSFRWKRVGSLNTNWKCAKDSHKLKTHPSDAVWWYDEPYSAVRTFVNTDLKSYAKGSITSDTIHKAIRSLSLAVDCAEVAPEWQELYSPDEVAWQVVGLLFVYNHDGQYDTEFGSILSRLTPSELRLPNQRRVVVLGPKDICELDTIYNDICRESQQVPAMRSDSAGLSLFYPDTRRVRLHRNRGWQQPIAIDTLTSPIIVYKVKTDVAVPDYDHLYVYYRRPGDTRDEFLYLIDYLFAFQQVRTANAIHVRLVGLTNVKAEVNFQNALEHYRRLYEPGDDLDKITCHRVTRTVTAFSELAIGME